MIFVTFLSPSVFFPQYSRLFFLFLAIIHSEYIPRMHLVFIAGQVSSVGGLRGLWITFITGRFLSALAPLTVTWYKMPRLGVDRITHFFLICLWSWLGASPVFVWVCVCTVHMSHILYSMSLLAAGVIITPGVHTLQVSSIFQRFFLWFCQHSDLMTCLKQNV